MVTVKPDDVKTRANEQPVNTAMSVGAEGKLPSRVSVELLVQMLEPIRAARLRPLYRMAPNRSAPVAGEVRDPPRRKVPEALHQSLCITIGKIGRANITVSVVK